MPGYAFRASFLRSRAILRRYVVNHVAYLASQVIFTYGVLLAALYGETPSGERVFVMLVGLLVWHAGSRFLAHFGGDLREEMSQGTMEQNCLTGVPLTGILVARAWTAMALDTFWGLLVMIPAYALLVCTRGVPAGVLLSEARGLAGVLVTFVLILAGLQGIGLTLASVVLRAKSVGLVSTVLGWALLFFTGVLFSPERYPVGLWYLAQLLPVTHGVQALHLLAVEGASIGLRVLWRTWGLLTVCSGCHLLLGAGFFALSERLVRARGMLSHF